MEISLVLSDTCGYHEETKEILKQAMEEAGVEADVAVTVIHQDEEAITVNCIASPTIRIDGLGIEYQEREPEERSAGQRYFNTPSGWKPYPEVGMIVRALDAAKQRDSGA